MDKPVLGIIGGIGPLATAYFMELLIRRTPASCDQENMPMIVINDPQIPDRTAYILDHTQPDPKPELVKVARRLEGAGADFLAIPCNTAHYFYQAINNCVSVPVLNIMEETARLIYQTFGRGARVGLLATEGTVKSGVFQDYLAQWKMHTEIPTAADQRTINTLIYDCIKANRRYDEADFLGVAERLHDRGCNAVIVGCTELSVIYQELSQRPSYLYDSLEILARRCCAYYAREHRRYAQEASE